MINLKLVGTLSIIFCAGMLSITANAITTNASCEDILKLANDTLTQNNQLSLEQKTALKACVKDGCQNYPWTLNCAHIRTLVNTPSVSVAATAPLQAPQTSQTQPEIKNTNASTPPAVNNISNQPTTTAPTTTTQPANGTKNSEKTSTTTPSGNSVNWF